MKHLGLAIFKKRRSLIHLEKVHLAGVLASRRISSPHSSIAC
jgi:hypothetical protein